MAHQARFNLHRTQAMATDFDDIIDTPLYTYVTLVVNCCGVTCKIDIRDSIPIGPIAGWIAIDCAHLAWPGMAHNQKATFAQTHRFAILINDISIDGWQW